MTDQTESTEEHATAPRQCGRCTHFIGQMATHVCPPCGTRPGYWS